jgi:hypothetical protein
MLEPGTRIAGFRIDGHLAFGGWAPSTWLRNYRAAEWLH